MKLRLIEMDYVKVLTKLLLFPSSASFFFSATQSFRYVLEIDVNVSSLGVANNLRSLVGNFSYPLLIENINITDIDVSTGKKCLETYP